MTWEPPLVPALEPTYRRAEELPAVVDDYGHESPRTVVEKSERLAANLVCSDLPDGRHMVVLDIDLPADLVPSTTPGHFHLYIAKPMTWRRYRAGVIERGFYAASKRRGYSSVRPPWVRKAAPLPF